jgi:hypothetical protein
MTLFAAAYSSGESTPDPVREKIYSSAGKSTESPNLDVTLFIINDLMAEGEGFEPPVPLQAQRFSRPPVSTAHPSLRGAWGCIRLYVEIGFSRRFRDGPISKGGASTAPLACSRYCGRIISCLPVRRPGRRRRRACASLQSCRPSGPQPPGSFRLHRQNRRPATRCCRRRSGRRARRRG